MEFGLICSVLAEYDLWYDGDLCPFYNVWEKYYQINSHGCCLQFLICLVGCRVFTGIINTRLCCHASCMMSCLWPQESLNIYHLPERSGEWWEESTVCSQNVDCKALSGSIFYRSELCSNRNSFSEEAYPCWDRSFLWGFGEGKCWLLQVVTNADYWQ